MRLTLSSAAAPELELPELLEACARRGLAGLELVAGHAHGIAPGIESREVAKRRRELAAGEVRLTGLYLPAAGKHDAAELARLSIAFGVPLVAPVEIAGPEVLARVAVIIAAEGGRLLLRHDTSEAAAVAAAEIVASIGTASVGTAWQIQPHLDDPAEVAAVLAHASPYLRYIRLLGGGPEAARQTGLGVGPLMSRLALARYAGPLVLAPSDPTYHYAWRAWLGRAGGWGCGSKVADGSIYSLQLA
jgi:hypothetical protein